MTSKAIRDDKFHRITKRAMTLVAQAKRRAYISIFTSKRFITYIFSFNNCYFSSN